MGQDRFQTANSHTGANGGRLSNSPQDQRRWTASAAAIGTAKTRPSRSTKSRQTGAGMLFEAKRGDRSTDTPTHPWETTIKKDGDELQAVVVEGRIMKGLLDPDLYELLAPVGEEPLPPVVIEIGDVVFIEITYPEGENDFIFDIGASDAATFTPFDLEDPAPDPPDVAAIVKARYPIALVVAASDDEGAPAKITQLARNNVALTTVCVDGEAVKYLLPV
jgi:hypothetical protein